MRQLLVLLLIVGSLPQVVRAQEAPSIEPPPLDSPAQRRRPLWELGAVAGEIFMPDYPASEESRWRFLPLPYFRYRGQMFRADEDSGARMRLVRETNVDFDVSAAVAFPVGRKANRAREEMPPLDWTGELGPRLRFSYEGALERTQWSVNLPLRSVFTTNFAYLKPLGFKFSPSIGYRVLGLTRWRIGLTAQFGLDFVTEGVADHLYEVRPEYARLDRPAYDARGGYLGRDFLLGAFRQGGPWEFFVAGRYSQYSGSSNEASPLFKRKDDFSVFMGLAFLFYQSESEGYK